MNLTDQHVSLGEGTEIVVCEPVMWVRNLEHRLCKKADEGVQDAVKLPEHLGHNNTSN
jgi:hypothetical protein